MEVVDGHVGDDPRRRGVAWLLKFWVIVATDGRVVAIGAAGAFFDIGLYSLLTGSTGLGVRPTTNQEPERGVQAHDRSRSSAISGLAGPKGPSPKCTEK